MRRWLGFTGSLIGGFYVCSQFGVLLHEFVGHGVIGVLCGGTFNEFTVLPGGGGWAWVDVPDRMVWVMQWGGIAVQLLTGLAAGALILRRRRHLSRTNLLLFLIAVTQTGAAIGYTLQGFLFRKGDSGHLASTMSMPVLVAARLGLAVLFLAFLYWGLRRLLLLLEENYEPASCRARYAAFVGSVIAPIGAFVVFAPAPTVFEASQRWLFYGCLFALLLCAGALFTRKRPKGAEPDRAYRPGVAAGMSWLLAAGATYWATVTWLSTVHVNWG